MRRALHLLVLVLGLSIGALPADAQTTNARWQATPASVLKSTLRNVVAAQDSYKARHGKYAGSLEAATESGWRAKATHRTRPGRSCVVFVGKLRAGEAPRTDGDGEMAGEERVPLCDRME
jgi:hypothetical protein